MIELIIKISISLLALCAGAYLATGGTLPYGIVAAGVVGIGQRELRFASIRYRPNRCYYQLAVVGV